VLLDGEVLVELPLIADENLNFNGNDGSAGRVQASVPGGVARRVYLARIGDPQKLFESCEQAVGAKPPREKRFCGAWATTPARQDRIAWVYDDAEYQIELTVAGNNVEAVQYLARVRFERIEDVDLEFAGMHGLTSVTVHWVEGLRPVSSHPSN
jgi:hypothetical protein